MSIPLKRESLVMLFALGVLSVMVIWIRTLTVKETYVFVKKERELRQAEYDLQNQRLRFVRLTSPAKLQMRGQELGLTVPKAQQIVQWKRIATQKVKP